MKICRLTLLLFALVFVQPTWAADISFSPNPGNVSQNNLFTLDITGTNFQVDIYGGGVGFVFDPNILQVLSVSIDPAIWNFVNREGTIDNVTGTVSDILVSAFPGVITTNFVVATIEFQAVSGGSSNLVLNESPINPFASDGGLINPTFTSGLVNVQGLIQPDGDINVDGQVNIIDVLLATRAVFGITTLSPDQLLHGNVAPLVGGVPAPDSTFNVADVLLINRKALGMINF